MKLQPTELHPLVQEYLHELHVLRQLSPHTLKAYRTDLTELQLFAADDSIELLKVGNAKACSTDKALGNDFRRLGALTSSTGLALNLTCALPA